ncbi:MAG: hypothetical protein ACR2RD_09990 [Woeseiaceae bacterium]
MSTSKITIIVLTLALLGSNVFWIYRSVDFGISYTYLEASATECKQMLNVAVAVIPTIADASSDKPKTIAVAEEAANTESFEKDGLVWIDGLGLGFDDSGRVVKATGVP